MTSNVVALGKPARSNTAGGVTGGCSAVVAGLDLSGVPGPSKSLAANKSRSTHVSSANPVYEKIRSKLIVSDT